MSDKLSARLSHCHGRAGLVPDQLAASALVKTLGQVVLHEFLDQVP